MFAQRKHIYFSCCILKYRVNKAKINGQASHARKRQDGDHHSRWFEYVTFNEARQQCLESK